MITMDPDPVPGPQVEHEEQGRPVECEVVHPGGASGPTSSPEERVHDRRRGWGKRWKDPAERGKRLEAHRSRRAEAVQEGVIVPRAVSRARGWNERSKAGASLSALLWKLGRKGRIVLDAYMSDPKMPDAALGELVDRTGAWVKKLKNTGTWRMAGMGLLDMVRPGQKLVIENAILEDAAGRLKDATGPGEAGALVKTREQAAAMLGIQVTPAEIQKVEHSGHVDLVHRMAAESPREALEEFNATGVWDEEKYGIPPWRRLTS